MGRVLCITAITFYAVYVWHGGTCRGELYWTGGGLIFVGLLGGVPCPAFIILHHSRVRLLRRRGNSAVETIADPRVVTVCVISMHSKQNEHSSKRRGHGASRKHSHQRVDPDLIYHLFRPIETDEIWRLRIGSSGATHHATLSEIAIPNQWMETPP